MPRQLDIRTLLDRMRDGDRDAAALFIRRYEGQIRRRIRWKLSQSVRRVFDSQEIVSTVGRRLDAFVRHGKLTAATEGELWSLIFRMADGAVVDKLRKVGRTTTGEDGGLLAAVAAPPMFDPAMSDPAMSDPAAPGARSRRPNIDLNEVRRLLNSRTDEQILDYWLQDTPLFKIADLLGLSASAVRQRWQRIKAVLRPHLPRPETRG